MSLSFIRVANFTCQFTLTSTLLCDTRELSCFSLLDTAILSAATKPKTLQTEEASSTGSNHNVTANTAQDREFIPFENERVDVSFMLLACSRVSHSFIPAAPHRFLFNFNLINFQEANVSSLCDTMRFFDPLWSSMQSRCSRRLVIFVSLLLLTFNTYRTIREYTSLDS